MRRPVATTLMLVSTLAAFHCGGSEDASSGERMFINAPSGLNLRSAPSMDARVIETIPYRTPVEVMERSEDAVTIDARTGHWVRIQYLGGSEPGWVFDGYLSWDKPEEQPWSAGELDERGVSVVGVDADHPCYSLYARCYTECEASRDLDGLGAEGPCYPTCVYDTMNSTEEAAGCEI